MVEFLIFLLLVALIPTILSGQHWRRWWILRREGVITTATVTHHWAAPLGLTKVYYVMYEVEIITADGEPFHLHTHAILEPDHYRAVVEGEPLAVRYADGHPRIFSVVGVGSQHWRWTAAALAAWAYFAFMALIIV